MTTDRVERIRRRAYELWVAEGRPESRDMEYWFRAEQEIGGADATPSEGGRNNEGEGNRTAAREFNRAQTAFVGQGDVEARAKEAKAAVEGSEGEELRQAEAAGRSRSRGEDPAIGAGPAQAGGQANEGEGNRTAAREFNHQEAEFVRAGQVEAKATEARNAVEGPEGEELRRAEATGKSRSRGEDPAVSASPARGAEPPNEGERNCTAAREFNRQETEFVRGGKVEAKALEAKKSVEGPEGEELRQAEAKGKSQSRGEDPAVSRAASRSSSSRGKRSKSGEKA